ncbi:MAG: permease [Gemmatimonadetes bacterium]|nr:permease [Gemmatimonadota bacterium]
MSILTDIVERVRALLFRGRDEREMDEELRFHVEMETAQNRRSGMDGVEARRRGLLALGGVERTKEEVRDARGTRWVEESTGDFAHALRTLSKSPGFVTVAVLTLAIGIGGTTAVFSAIDTVLLRPLPYQEPGRLVRLYQAYGRASAPRGFVTPVHFLAYRAQLSSLQATAAILTYSESGADIGGAEHPERIRVLPVSADYFAVTLVPPRLGRGFEAAEENGAPVVVLSDALWQRQYRGDPSVVGRQMMMSGKSHAIVGVLPPGFADPVAGAIDALVPIDVTPGKDASNASNHYLTIIGRLRPDVTVARAQAEVDGLDRALGVQYPAAKEKHTGIEPLKSDVVAPVSRSLELMLGAVGLILLLVCVNIANLLLVRGSERGREFALRTALGADRSRLVRQLLVESLTLALLGDVAGLVVARLAMSAIVVLGAGTIPRLEQLSLDPRLLVFSLGVASLSAIVFGLAPALRAARTQPGDVLREQTRSTAGSSGQSRLSAGLVVSQVALAFILLVGAGLLLVSFERIRQIDLGVATNDVLAFELNLPGARYDSTARGALYERFARAVEAIPRVRAAGGVSKLPATGGYNSWGVQALTGPVANSRAGSIGAEERVISGDYFRAVGIPLVAGRIFDGRDDARSSHKVVVSKSTADRIFPGVDPIGQRLNTGGLDCEVIGVVPDVAVDAEGKRDSYVYHAHAQFAGDRNWALTQVVSAAGPAMTLVPDVRAALAALDPQLVMYHPMPLTDAIGRGTATRVFTMRILVCFALVALGLAALGLFGVLSYAVRMRAREFGIRMALGAPRGRIRLSVMKQGLGVTAVGVAVGLAGALALSRVMQSLVFQVSPTDPHVLVGAAVFMALVAAAAAYLPARRATSVDPREVLQ